MFAKTFGTSLGTLLEPFEVILSSVGASLKPISMRTPLWEQCWPVSDPPRCSGACKYGGQLDVAHFDPRKLLEAGTIFRAREVPSGSL